MTPPAAVPAPAPPAAPPGPVPAPPPPGGTARERALANADALVAAPAGPPAPLPPAFLAAVRPPAGRTAEQHVHWLHERIQNGAPFQENEQQQVLELMRGLPAGTPLPAQWKDAAFVRKFLECFRRDHWQFLSNSGARSAVNFMLQHPDSAEATVSALRDKLGEGSHHLNNDLTRYDATPAQWKRIFEKYDPKSEYFTKSIDCALDIAQGEKFPGTELVHPNRHSERVYCRDHAEYDRSWKMLEGAANKLQDHQLDTLITMAKAGRCRLHPDFSKRGPEYSEYAQQNRALNVLARVAFDHPDEATRKKAMLAYLTSDDPGRPGSTEPWVFGRLLDQLAPADATRLQEWSQRDPQIRELYLRGLASQPPVRPSDVRDLQRKTMNEVSKFLEDPGLVRTLGLSPQQAEHVKERLKEARHLMAALQDQAPGSRRAGKVNGEKAQAALHFLMGQNGPLAPVLRHAWSKAREDSNRWGDPTQKQLEYLRGPKFRERLEALKQPGQTGTNLDQLKTIMDEVSVLSAFDADPNAFGTRFREIATHLKANGMALQLDTNDVDGLRRELQGSSLLPEQKQNATELLDQIEALWNSTNDYRKGGGTLFNAGTFAARLRDARWLQEPGMVTKLGSKLMGRLGVVLGAAGALGDGYGAYRAVRDEEWLGAGMKLGAAGLGIAATCYTFAAACSSTGVGWAPALLAAAAGTLSLGADHYLQWREDNRIEDTLRLYHAWQD